MPTGKGAQRFFERLKAVEVQVDNLMTFQKWQMGLLAAILLIAIKGWLGR